MSVSSPLYLQSERVQLVFQGLDLPRQLFNETVSDGYRQNNSPKYSINRKSINFIFAGRLVTDTNEIWLDLGLDFCMHLIKCRISHNHPKDP